MRMCTCLDQACGDLVNHDLTTWSEDMAKRAGAKRATPNAPERMKQLTETMTAYTGCYTKLVMSRPAGTGP